ncbi:MAG: hypothetical protein JNN30_15890 [Rhodanobacteraceae bacterium]|nr:hypothetical protein [Rhodanobacteraceae bacterium]
MPGFRTTPLTSSARSHVVSQRRASALHPLPALLLCTAAVASMPAAAAGGCEANFAKNGSPFSGTQYTSYVTVDSLSPTDALSQMRGILIAEKMDVITEDPEGGTLLVEQRATATARAIPTMVTVTGKGAATKIDLMVRIDKGVLAKQDDIKRYMCELLAKVEGGEAGRLAATEGAKAQNAEFSAQKDAFLFSMEIAREAKANAVALNARHKGRSYTLSGKIDYIQQDGEDYNVSFDIPEMRDRALSPLPGQANFRVGVACLFRPNQLATVLTLREKQRVTFTGTFYRYDDFKKMAWLENCKQVR